MIKHYLKIAWKSITRHKADMFINIFGLSSGLAFCLLILVYIQHEKSYDTFHDQADRIYRIQRDPFARLAPSFTPLLKKDFPEIERVFRLFGNHELEIKIDNNRFLEQKFCFAENDLFKTFTIPFLYGDPETALSEPNKIVLTETTAKKYFSEENPIGKKIMMEQEGLFEVSGVIRDFPENMHFNFNMAASYISLEDEYFQGDNNFSDNICYTYVLLNPGTDPAQLEAKLPDFLYRSIGYRPEDIENDRNKLTMIKASDIHLHSHALGEFETNGDINYVHIFSLVGFLILLVAGINYINLTTAKGSIRSKEVGLKKVVGASKKHLIFQFFCETLLHIFISFAGALLILALLSPYYKQILPVENILLMINRQTLITTLLVISGTFMVLGIYPALTFSKYNPVLLLKGNVKGAKQGIGFRQVLVVFQLFISVSLIASVLILQKQMSYIKNSKLGFGQENVVMFPVTYAILDRWDDVKKALLQNSSVESVTFSKRAPGGELLDDPGFNIVVNGERYNSSFTMPHNRVGFDFFKTYDIPIIAGRDFDENISTDADKAYILNETAVKRLGITQPDEIIGAPIFGDGKVIGVARDFHYESLRKEIVPIITYITKSEASIAAVKLKNGSLRSSIAEVSDILKSYFPDYDFDFTFLDQRIDDQYRHESRMLKVIGWLGILAVLIASIGVFGLVLFMIERRIKEIGVRKVNGARVGHILLLLNKEFVYSMLIAFMLAVPVTGYFMGIWLQNFAYKTEMSWWIFLLAGIVSFGIAVLTISLQSLNAARRNPVEILRYE